MRWATYNRLMDRLVAADGVTDERLKAARLLGDSLIAVSKAQLLGCVSWMISFWLPTRTVHDGQVIFAIPCHEKICSISNISGL
jgi:hypothetical protein